jgi:hypothetical protein
MRYYDLRFCGKAEMKMRLYGMYYTCKMYLETVQNMEIGSKVITAGPVKYIEGWNEKSIIYK